MSAVENFKSIILKPKVLIMAVLGFSAGLPILMVLSTLSAWLSEAGVSRASIGFASWVGLAHGFKYLWSPIVDKVKIPIITNLLGRRRSWMLIAQISIIIAILGMANSDPKYALAYTIGFAVMLAFSSATQDIAVDGLRIEATGKDKEEQALMATIYIYGYRVAMLLAGGGVLWLADTGAEYDFNAWNSAYLYMALAMIPCVLSVLFLLKEPDTKIQSYVKFTTFLTNALTQYKKKLEKRILIANTFAIIAILIKIYLGDDKLFNVLHQWCFGIAGLTMIMPLEPFKDFFDRYGKQFLILLGITITFRISDISMGVMANPFYLDLGFTKTEIAWTVKTFGFWVTFVGIGFGGVLLGLVGMRNSLIIVAILTASSNLLFSVLAGIGNDINFLYLTISVDNLSAGMAYTIFVAFLTSIVNKEYSGTQYALLSSFMMVIPKFISGYSGVAVDNVGYSWFWIITALAGIPALIFIVLGSKIISANK